jgi:hypothetical protein
MTNFNITSPHFYDHIFGSSVIFVGNDAKTHHDSDIIGKHKLVPVAKNEENYPRALRLK